MRLTTAKVWLHLDLVPSLVGGAAEAFLPPPLQTLFIILIISFPSSSVLPSRPKHVRAVEITQSSLRLSWTPGFGGDYPIIRCSVQVKKKRLCVTEMPPLFVFVFWRQHLTIYKFNLKL